MKEEQNPAETGNTDRRAHPRYPVDGDATLYLINGNLGYPCRLVDLSQEGCRVSTAKPMFQGAKTRVELAFKVRGMAFRLTGSTEWMQEHHLLGIHFTAMSPRRRDDLLELLDELAAHEAKQAAEKAAKAEAEARAAEEAARNSTLKVTVKPNNVVELAIAGPADHPRVVRAAPPPPGNKERRVDKRHSVDSRATIFLLDLRAQAEGKIVDVSMSGCRIRTDQQFPVGIYRRVEVGFVIDGLPFRLGGVTQAVRDKNLVGIRFLDISDRKREQLKQIIDEIEEMHTEGKIHRDEM